MNKVLVFTDDVKKTRKLKEVGDCTWSKFKSIAEDRNYNDEKALDLIAQFYLENIGIETHKANTIDDRWKEMIRREKELGKKERKLKKEFEKLKQRGKK